MSPLRAEWPAVAVAGYLVLQVGRILSAPWHHERSFAWAPLHEQVRFHVAVERAGQQLSEDDITRRYGRGRFYDSSTGEDWQLNELSRTLDVIEQTELRAHDGAAVTVLYRRNGGPEQVWRWPR